MEKKNEAIKAPIIVESPNQFRRCHMIRAETNEKSIGGTTHLSNGKKL